MASLLLTLTVLRAAFASDGGGCWLGHFGIHLGHCYRQATAAAAAAGAPALAAAAAAQQAAGGASAAAAATGAGRRLLEMLS